MGEVVAPGLACWPLLVDVQTKNSVAKVLIEKARSGIIRNLSRNSLINQCLAAIDFPKLSDQTAD